MLSAIQALGFLMVWMASPGAVIADRTPSLEAQAILGRYVGTWEGRYVVRLPGGEPLLSLVIAAEYAWDGDRVVGHLRRQADGDVETSQVELGMGKDGLWMRIKRAAEADGFQWYRGEVIGNAIEWVPIRDDPEKPRERVFRDYFLRTDGGRVQIATRAVDTVKMPDGSNVTVQVEGFLIPSDSGEPEIGEEDGDAVVE